jgi:hypothetical protein
MKCKDFIGTVLAVVVGGAVTLFGEYWSRKDLHFQDQLKIFRDNALQDAITINSDLDRLYDQCLHYSKLFFIKESDIKISEAKTKLVKEISLYTDHIDRLKLDFAYFEINEDEIFKSAKARIDDLGLIFSPFNDKENNFSDKCHQNVHELEILHKSLRSEIINSVKPK